MPALLIRTSIWPCWATIDFDSGDTRIEIGNIEGQGLGAEPLGLEFVDLGVETLLAAGVDHHMGAILRQSARHGITEAERTTSDKGDPTVE